ncbi:MAG: hypothetical protein FD166_519 [Bacteroidetes bacterium]|nr:MAG: hypothetical protein FD166_519 [Bacteroidota bacterium]
MKTIFVKSNHKAHPQVALQSFFYVTLRPEPGPCLTGCKHPINLPVPGNIRYHEP